MQRLSPCVSQQANDTGRELEYGAISYRLPQRDPGASQDQWQGRPYPARIRARPDITMDQSLQGAASAVRTIALQMLEERGRGAVLVGVARVDAALERLLLSVLLPSPGRSDALFQPDRPLGSFGARISLAHRLGLIESPVERALHTLRRVRNAFAHSSESASLGDPAYAERLAQAYRDAHANPLWAPLESVLSKAGASGEPPVDPALRDYILLITILVAFLEAAAQLLSPQPPAVVMGFGGIQLYQHRYSE